ncbi:uncharacterized protein G2W53_014312 [Senna tora]|uniref:Uncharacterized protein n=1 Tax=Senna tora TaxID=362788 RepID=A0A834WTF8_9FABA|nr:uncharacterized protein G2W53_014312 [Senna tora]
MKEREEEEVTIFDNGRGSKMKKEEAPFYHGDGLMIASVPEELSTTEEFAAKSKASSQMPNARCQNRNYIYQQLQKNCA